MSDSPLRDDRRAVSTIGKLLDELAVMEEQVGRKGFDAGTTLGAAAAHEIRALTSHLRADDSVVIAAGDKLGDVRIGVFSRTDGAPLRDGAWRVLPPLPSGDDKRRVVDALCIVTTSAGEWLVIGTRGNGAWIVSVEAALDPKLAFEPQQLEGSAGKIVRRLLADAPSSMVWAAVDARLIGWQINSDGPAIISNIDVGARITALGVDAGGTVAEDDLYLATNLSTLHRVRRGADLRFDAGKTPLTAKNAVWCGRASVIETIIPLSRIVRYDGEARAWVRRFTDRGIVATTLRHIMVMADGGDGQLVCDVRRVVVYSKILAAAPICLPRWSGIAVATLEGKIRLFRPSGMRRPDTDFTPYCEDAPENLVSRSVIGGYEEIDFLHERAYALLTFLPSVEAGEDDAPVILGMGDHTVRFHRFTVIWNLRKRANEIGQKIVASADVADLLQELEAQTLHPDKAAREKYAAAVLLPEIGAKCRTPALWRQLKLLVWDILAGTDAPELQKVSVHVVQSLRRLQSLYPKEQEAIEQTITGIRKHIFDRDSFSGKTHDFRSLTRSTDPDLNDDRVVYESILISRRHDPVFRQSFDGEVRAFAAVPPTSPSDGWRFIVGTYGGKVSLFDGVGNRCNVDGIDSANGYVQSMLVLPKWIVFAFSKAPICWVSRAEIDQPLPAQRTLDFETVVDDSAGARALAAIPGAHGNEERFLWADAAGQIHVAPYEDRVVARLPKEPGSFGQSAITALQSFVAPVGGTPRKLFVAGTEAGEIHLFEWDEEEAEAQHRGCVRVGNNAVSALLVHRVDLMQIVAGCVDGNVTGVWVIDNGGEPSLSVYWAFRADDAVHDLQRLPLNIGTANGDDRLIGIASHDHHLHVVDHTGRHLDAIYLQGLKLDRFSAVPEQADGIVECRVYGCAFENDFFCVRLISRREMLDHLGNEVAKLDDDERERRLTRWRAFAIPEGHLRHRFVRQSRRYPGPGADAAIRDIERLIRIGSNDNAPTGIVKALLQRLFQNSWPGEKKPPERPMGLKEMLADETPEKPADETLYARAFRLLRQLEERWDTPGSYPNRRVQYFWIRSLLRNIEDLSMLRQWIAVSKKLADTEPLAAPGDVLYHYLEHPSTIVQFKALQCVERLLFGWPGVEQPGVFMTGETVERDDLEWLLGALLSRLRSDAADIAAEKPNVVVLQIGKMLCDLVRIGCVDALYLAYEMQHRGLPVKMFDVLAGQCSIMAQPDARAAIHDRTSAMTAAQRTARNAAEDERLRRAADAFRAVARLHHRLTTRDRTENIVEAVGTVVKYCDDATASPYADFLRQTVLFYRDVLPLLRVAKLDDINNLPADVLAETSGGTSPAFEPLAGFRDVIEKVKIYRVRKYADLWSENVLCALQFEDFDDARAAWRGLRTKLDNASGISELERLLFQRLIWLWDRVFNTEQSEELLRDLLEVAERKTQIEPTVPGGAARAAERLEEAEAFMAVALKSFLMRLVLFAEPERAALIHRNAESSVTVWSFDQASQRRPAIVEPGAADWPDWLDHDWSLPPVISKVDNVEASLTERVPALKWASIAIPDMADPTSRVGYFLLAWKPDAPGNQRYEAVHVMWKVLLQSLSYRNASLRHEALAGRIFSTVAHNFGAPVFQLRSNVRLLTDGVMEDDAAARMKKYEEILRQGRNMQGIIDAILSMDGRHVKPEITSVSMAKLVHDVVRTLRPEAKHNKNVTIDFQQPDDELVELTRVATDEVRVYDILLNLVGNAVKYSPKHGTVTVKVNVTTRGTELRIRDQGPTIPEEEKTRIFKPFVRGQASAGVPGLGLGLYVVDLYTKSLHGRVQIHNETERGKSFVVYLPPWSSARQEENATHAHSRN